MIVIKNISKRFGKLLALDHINLQLSPGACVALIGPNACGKTTLIKTILGMVKPGAGTVYFDGKDISGNDDYRQQIGYMPQIGRYPENMTIGQVLDMIKGIRNSPAAPDLELYEQFEIGKMLHKKMRTLSGGTTLGSTQLSYNVANINECAAKCRPVSNCAGFTFNAAGSGNNHACMIFGPTPEGRTSKGWVSGER